MKGNFRISKLFRPEAIQHATRRLGGDVVLISPLSVWLLGRFVSGVGIVITILDLLSLLPSGGGDTLEVSDDSSVTTQVDGDQVIFNCNTPGSCVINFGGG